MSDYTIAKLPKRVVARIAKRMKIDTILGPSGDPVVNFAAVPNAVNAVTVTNAVSGAKASLSAPDGLDLTGTVTINGVSTTPGAATHAATSKTTPVDADELALIDSEASNALKKLTIANLKTWWSTVTATLTNKTLTDPKINAVKDTNGVTVIGLTAAASAVNSITIANSATNVAPSIRPVGDANLNMSLVARGTGNIRLQDTNFVNVLTTAAGVASAVNYVTVTNAATGNAPSVAANGTDTNVDLTLAGRGTGIVKTSGKLGIGGTTATITAGTGTPEGVVTASIGSIFMRTDGGANTSHYVKESGAGNTGWVAK